MNRVYSIGIAMKTKKDGDVPNFDERKLVAYDVLDALKKVKLNKDEYVEEVKIITELYDEND